MSDSEVAETQPTLFKDRSFWGMAATQFLGAFNDNLYKQLMLLLAVPVVLVSAAGTANVDIPAGTIQAVDTVAESVPKPEASGDMQGWATLVFSLPFVLFSGFAGYISDRFRKTPIIYWCKVTEIVIMLLGLAAFYYYDMLGMFGTWVVLFLMGTQSTFFGPGKYGVLPELFRAKDLPRANSLILMSTFLAIIFGTVMAGVLKDALTDDDGSTSSIWIGMLVCVGIAIVGTITSLVVRKTPPAKPEMELTPDSFGVSREVRTLLKQDRVLLGAVAVSSVFWLVSGLTVPTVNRLGRWMECSDTMTSLLTASIALGIMGGAPIASLLCRKGFGDRSVTFGLFGIFVTLVALGVSWQGQHILGFYGSVFALVLLGGCAAVFSIPIQVFLQDRPPAELKGRMIATMNQANFTGILISGPLYQVFEGISDAMGWPISSVFWMMALLMLPVAALYRLKS